MSHDENYDPLPPEEWPREPAYLEGIALFNAGKFWESHEAWEKIWLQVDGTHSEFMQGLIQSAAALLKFERHELAPALRLYETAMRRLSLTPDRYMGLDVRGFQALMKICFEPILTSLPGQISEPIERDKIPKIAVS